MRKPCDPLNRLGTSRQGKVNFTGVIYPQPYPNQPSTMRVFAFAAAAVMLIVPPRWADGLDNGASPTPYLGWSSWNAFGDISTHSPAIGAAALLDMADAMVASGLRDAGYVYFNVDAGWAHAGAFMGRNSNGTLQVGGPVCLPPALDLALDEGSSAVGTPLRGAQDGERRRRLPPPHYHTPWWPAERPPANNHPPPTPS